MTKILLVEDDKSLREIYGVRLLAEGYDIVSAGDGEEALAMAIKEKPTLIISDVMMPKISGFDMLDILRSTTETRDIRVIMMTALSSDDQRTRGEQLGADRYLVKSQVGIEDVVRTVHEVLEDNGGVVASAVAATSTSVTAPAEEASAVTPEPVEPVVTVPDPLPEPVANPVAEPVVAIPAEDTAVAASAPDLAPVPEPAATEPAEETGPGPLPPQPSEDVSVLPQPTAPFSSPRPTNLGERVIHPLDEQEAANTVTPSDIGDQIAKELQASAEPVSSSQVDEAISDADVEPLESSVTTAEPAVAETSSTAELPETPVAPDLAPVPEPAAPAVPDEKPPTITGTSSPVS